MSKKDEREQLVEMKIGDTSPYLFGSFRLKKFLFQFVVSCAYVCTD